MRDHLPEYLMEAFGLGVFLLMACTFAVMLEHPEGGWHGADPDLRRLVMALAMGLTCVTLVYSPWGQQSGAHYNPAVTLTFAALGRIPARDVAGYVLAQTAGGSAGVLFASALLGPMLGHPDLDYVATRPGPAGAAAAFAGEAGISALMMLAVLTVSNSRHARMTGWVAGALLAVYIFLESPISGASMNPARSIASAVLAGHWEEIPLYVAAPLLGMALGAAAYTMLQGPALCAKLHHDGPRRCIFRCGYHEGGEFPCPNTTT